MSPKLCIDNGYVSWDILSVEWIFAQWNCHCDVAIVNYETCVHVAFNCTWYFTSLGSASVILIPQN